MDVKEKYRIVEKIIQTEDDDLLGEIRDLLGLSDEDFWNNLPSEAQASIAEAEKQLEGKEGIPHKSVWKEVKERIKK